MRYPRTITIFTAALAAVILLATGCAGTGAVRKPTVKAQVRQYEPHGAVGEGIKWRQWDDAAFREARSADKLVFLDVSATWCHWCMVMEQTAYADPRVVEMLNSRFVPVYVDTDKRPDINDRYNQGGWPSIAVLTPDGRVLAGRTTMSADELVTLLDTVYSAYSVDREAVYDKLASLEESLEESKKELEKDRKQSELNAEIPFRVLRSLNLFVDPEYGGYGGPQKFPMPEVMQFALYLYPRLKGSKEYSPANAIRLTLDGMADGLLDGVEGGFFRYSTSIDWKSPHYEKLLSTNGDLLGIYMRAYQLLGDKRYLRVAESVAGYMEGVLLDEASGVFHTSQAADERYYGLGLDDRRQAGAPPVDGTVLADANARAALGYLEAYRATGERRYMAVALPVVEHIMAKMYVEGEGVSHTEQDSSGVLLLSDQVYPALAAVTAYQATGNHRYLDFAAGLAAVMTERFWDPEKQGLFDSYYRDNPVGLLARRNKPQIENSKAAVLLMDLYHITGIREYKDTAMRAIKPYTAEYTRHSFWAAPFAHAVERCLETTYEFIVIGGSFEPPTMDLVTRSFRYDDSDRVVVALDPERDRDRIAKLGYTYTGTPVLYVCSERACFPPVKPGETLEQTREQIEKARAQ